MSPQSRLVWDSFLDFRDLDSVEQVFYRSFLSWGFSEVLLMIGLELQI